MAEDSIGFLHEFGKTTAYAVMTEFVIDPEGQPMPEFMVSTVDGGRYRVKVEVEQ